MAIDWTSVADSLGLTGTVTNASQWLVTRLAAFKALPLTFDKLTTQQTALLSALEQHTEVSSDDLARVQNVTGTLTSLRGQWALLNPQVDSALGNGTDAGGALTIAAQAVSIMRQTDQVGADLQSVSDKYLSAAEKSAVRGGLSPVVVGVVLAALYLLAKRR